MFDTNKAKIFCMYKGENFFIFIVSHVAISSASYV